MTSRHKLYTSLDQLQADVDLVCPYNEEPPSLREALLWQNAMADILGLKGPSH